MRAAITGLAAMAVAVLTVASPASAFEGGGRKPSEAPLIAVGQHYTGQLNNHADDANYGSYVEAAHWRLPPLSTRDVVVIDWHSAPYTRSPGSFPLCLTLAQGIDDFNWGTVFRNTTGGECGSGSAIYRPSGSGAARSEITVQETNASSSYLQFFAYGGRTNPSELETYPYDFTVEPILHYLAAAIPPVKRISAGGILHATATLASGLPAPDGLPFNLAVTWPGGGVASYTTVSSGGSVSFQLTLPETAYGKQATFVASHPADGTYQAVTTPKLEALVAKPKVVPVQVSPCEKATRRAHAVARQYKRLKRNAATAHGATRRHLRRQALQVGHRLRAARAQANRECGR